MKALYLEPDEEITSVVDRLREIDDIEVAIVVPKRAGLLQSIVNLKLLRYQGEQLKKRISLVTTDKTGRNLASAVGLTVYQKLPEGSDIKEAAVKEPAGTPVPITYRQKTARRAPEAAASPRRPAMAKQPLAEPPATPTAAAPSEATPPQEPTKPAAKATSSTKRRLPKPRVPKLAVPASWRKRRWPLLAAVLLACATAGIAAAAIVLPKATITVTPKTDPFSAEVPVTFSARATALDPAAKVIPAKVIEVTTDATVEQPATGSKESGGKATGQITVVNTLSRPQSLVARTRFQSSDGRIYRAQSGLSVPAKDQAAVTVVADDGGEAGNLPAGTRLAIPGLTGDAVYGQVDTALTGGTSSPTPEVSDADVEKAKVAVASQAAKTAVEQAKPKLAVGYRVNDQIATTNVANVRVNPPVGSQVGKFTLTATVRISYFSYPDGDLQQVVSGELKGKIPSGTDLVADSASQQFVIGQASGDRLSGSMVIAAATTQALSKDQIKQAVSGKSPAAAESALQQTGKVSGTQIKLSPFWVRSVPTRQNKIVIRYVSGMPQPSPQPTSGQSSSSPAASVPPSL